MKFIFNQCGRRKWKMDSESESNELNSLEQVNLREPSRNVCTKFISVPSLMG